MSIDFRAGKADVLACLREVAGLAEDSGAESLADKLRDDRIPRLEGERFHLVVLGEFNHGKTTFVNALLGERVLPMGVTPTTALIHHIEHGDTPSARAVSENGDKVDVPICDLEDFMVGGDGARDDVHFLELSYPSTMLAEGVVLVDTPGVNDLNHQRAEITYGYIPRSDAVIFLLDAGQILKESERQFIANKLLTASRDKLLFVINKADLLDDAEQQEALAYARKHLADIVDDPKVFSLSAERALDGDREGSGIDPFVAELTRFLQQERGRVLLDNALDLALRTSGVLRTSVEVQRRVLSMEQSDLDGRLSSLEADLDGSESTLEGREQAVREALAAVRATTRKEVVDWAHAFAASLPEEIEASKADDLRRYLPGFIEDRFREFADQEANEVAKRLERVAEQAIAFVTDDAEDKANRLREVLGPAAQSLDLKVNTFAYDVGVFALGAFGVTIMALSNVLVGGALTLAAPVLAYVFRGRADQRVKERALEEGPKAIIEAAEKLADAFEDQIDVFGDKLVDFVRRATEEMTRSIADVIRTARDAKREGESSIQELETSTGSVMARLGAVDDRMKSLRAGLWANGTGTNGD